MKQKTLIGIELLCILFAAGFFATAFVLSTPQATPPQPDDYVVCYIFEHSDQMPCYIVSWSWLQVNETYGLWIPHYTPENMTYH